ncbi:hypothetical protein Ddc_18165 [Ditylenchus destructor]|nr:hypothetical protein Ddc_18165 [Ditylenchus destructor]
MESALLYLLCLQAFQTDKKSFHYVVTFDRCHVWELRSFSNFDPGEFHLDNESTGERLSMFRRNGLAWCLWRRSVKPDDSIWLSALTERVTPNRIVPEGYDKEFYDVEYPVIDLESAHQIYPYKHHLQINFDIASKMPFLGKKPVFGKKRPFWIKTGHLQLLVNSKILVAFAKKVWYRWIPLIEYYNPTELDSSYECDPKFHGPRHSDWASTFNGVVPRAPPQRLGLYFQRGGSTGPATAIGPLLSTGWFHGPRHSDWASTFNGVVPRVPPQRLGLYFQRGGSTGPATAIGPLLSTGWFHGPRHSDWASTFNGVVPRAPPQRLGLYFQRGGSTGPTFSSLL